MPQISKKIILVGHFNVGKTSLTRRFVHSKFSEEYLTTIGVNIEKKTVQIDDTEVSMIIWDLAGEDTLVKSNKKFLLGSHGVIYVFDLTREATYHNINEQMELLKEILPFAPISIIGNKADLITEEESAKVVKSLDVKVNYTSSAKTGENVEEMFMNLAKAMI